MIDKLIDDIRDFINSPRKQYELLSDSFSWNMLCSSMDTIEDSELAIEAYKKLPSFDGFTGGYLYIYGLLQALYLQQNAANHLSQSLFKKKIDFKNDYPELFKIREMRYDTIGHPTNNGKSFCVISRMSLNNSGYTVAHYIPHKQYRFEGVKFEDILNIQSDLVTQILQKIKSELEMEDELHKKKFTNKDLISIVPSTMNYHISKLYEGIYSTNSTRLLLIKIDLDFIKKILDEIKTGIIERYGNINAVDEVKRLFTKFEYILNHLTELLENNSYYNNLNTEVHIDSFKKEFELLKEILKEIDEEYSKSV